MITGFRVSGGFGRGKSSPSASEGSFFGCCKDDCLDGVGGGGFFADTSDAFIVGGATTFAVGTGFLRACGERLIVANVCSLDALTVSDCSASFLSIHKLAVCWFQLSFLACSGAFALVLLVGDLGFNKSLFFAFH